MVSPYQLDFFPQSDRWAIFMFFKNVSKFKLCDIKMHIFLVYDETVFHMKVSHTFFYQIDDSDLLTDSLLIKRFTKFGKKYMSKVGIIY